METSIIINMVKPNGDNAKRSVTNIDSNATANQLIEFAGKLAALSTYSYSSTERVDKTELVWTEANDNG